MAYKYKYLKYKEKYLNLKIQMGGTIDKQIVWNLTEEKNTDGNNIEYKGSIENDTNEYKWVGKQTNNPDNTQDFEGTVKINNDKEYYIKFNNAKYTNTTKNGAVITSNFEYTGDSIINKEELNKILLRDIPDLDEEPINMDLKLDEKNLFNDIQTLILFFKIYNYLREKFTETNITKISKDQLLNSLKSISPDDHSYEKINKIFNAITDDELLNILNKLNKYKEYFNFTPYHSKLVKNEYDDYVYNVILSDTDFFLTTVKHNTSFIFHVDFTPNFIDNFKTGSDKTYDGYTYKGLWFTTIPTMMSYYIKEACVNSTGLNSSNFTTKPVISLNYFVIIKEIPNVMVLSNNCNFNIRVLVETIRKLKIKDLDEGLKNELVDKYLTPDCKHGVKNYYFAVYINELNKINTTKINGWINIIDSGEIFICFPDEFLKLDINKEITKIINTESKKTIVYYDNEIDENNGFKECGFNHNSKYDCITTSFINGEEKIKETINITGEDTRQYIIPTIYPITSEIYIDIKPIKE